MTKFTRCLGVLAVLLISSCTSSLAPEEPSLESLNGTEWFYTQQVAEFEILTVQMVFSDNTCRIVAKLQLGPLPAKTTDEELVHYTLGADRVTLLIPNATEQAVGVFHNNYTQLELVDQQVHYLFERVK